MSYQDNITKKNAEEYWLNHLRKACDLSSNGFNSATGDVAGDNVQVVMPSNITAHLKQLFPGENGSAGKFLFLELALKILYQRYSGLSDIVVATVISGNIVFLRTQLNDENSFRELFAGEQKLFRRTEMYSNYDYRKFIQKLEFNGLGTERQLLQIGFLCDPSTHEISLLEECRMSLMVSEDRVSLKFNSQRLETSTALRFVHNYIATLEALLADRSQKIRDVNILSQKEKEDLARFGQPQAIFDITDTVLEHFSRQVENMPDHTAIVFGEKKLSYKELDQRSDAVAWFLKNTYGIGPAHTVAILFDRTEQLPVVTIGILKTGSAYVAIDQVYPDERKLYVLQDSTASLLVTESIYVNNVSKYWDGVIIGLDDIPWGEAPAFPAVHMSPEAGAFMIYTSGSTGMPKGMMQTHKCLLNVVMRQAFYGGFEHGLNVLQYSSVSFDVYIAHELFFALLSGGTLFIITEEQRKDLTILGRYIFERGIEWLLLSVSALNMIVEISEDLWKEGLKLKHIVSAGEQLNLSRRLIAYLKQHPGIRLHNFYGPSETHNATNYTITNLDDLGVEQPVGRPSTNTWIFILSGTGHLAPVGVPGEIFISGAGLAQGYIGKPDLTRERFIPNPYMPEELMYTSGDIAKWLPDGNIMYMGRKDDQVKIRGQRVELGEIENVLLKHPMVQRCAVVAREQAGVKELIGYVVGTDTVSVRDIREYLLSRLPDYMVPGFFVQLNDLPLNSNGKIDRKKLPAPEALGVTTGVEYVAPADQVEEQLVQLWQEILGKEKIGVLDNFFELGGHSLKATRLISRIHREFGVKISLKDLFMHVILKDQARLIAHANRTAFVNIDKVAPKDGYPLSAAQRRLWILYNLTKENAAYNLPGVYVLKGQLNMAALSSAFQSLISRHEILCTVFRQDGNCDILQYVNETGGGQFAIACYDLCGEEEREKKVITYVEQEMAKPFDLASGPLLRVNLYRTEEDRWVLTCTMHHIVSDGWSMGVLIRDLLHFYNEFGNGDSSLLQPLRIQYKDYAAWQNQRLADDAIEEHKAYWLQELSGELPVLDLPLDRKRLSVRSNKGGRLDKVFDKQLVSSLRSAAHEKGASLFMGLLAIVNALLHRLTGQQDIIVGSPVAGRDHTDLGDQIGFYVNMLALRARLADAVSFNELLIQTRRVTLQVYEHQLYPFDELVEVLQVPRNTGRNPVFDVTVSLQEDALNNSIPISNKNELTVTEYKDVAFGWSKFDLSFNFFERAGDLSVSITYNIDVFNQDTIIRLAGYLENLSRLVLTYPDKPIYELNYVSEAEKNKILLDFNDNNFHCPQQKTITRLFEEQAGRTPDNIALTYKDKRFTFEELNSLSNQMAAWLKANYDVKVNDLVMIRSARSEWMFIAMLGIMKSGAAFVPIDPGYPQVHIQYVIEDSKPKAIIDISEFEKFWNDRQQYDDGNNVLENAPGDLVYVMYTSGSTGRPKGVMIEHGSLLDYYYGVSGRIDFTNCKRFGFFTTLAADLPMTVILASLLTGGTLCVFSEEEILDPAKIADARLDCLKIVPSHWRELQGDHGLTLVDKCLIFGGEALTKNIIDQIRSQKGKCRVYNHYGPTETTIGKIAAEIDLTNDDTCIALGTPFGNNSIYILDEHEMICPVGVAGQISIAGTGVARGYLNQPELTMKKFSGDPFGKHERMYKTGDLGRWLSNGNIEFLGRKDDQVKIRGHRIELKEVAYALRNHGDIQDVVVEAKGSPAGEMELVAYLVSNKELQSHEIHAYLKDLLPYYMIPTHFVQLGHLPLMPNGKLNRKNLPDPVGIGIQTGTAYVPPGNEIEARLAAVWEEVLSKEKIGIKDNFFELGGHSLKAMQVIARINKLFDVELTPMTFFVAPTIENIALEIDKVYWSNRDFSEVDNAENFSI